MVIELLYSPYDMAIDLVSLAIIGIMLFFASILNAWISFRISQIATSTVVAHVQTLDNALGEAIKGIVEGEMGNFEPPNPLIGIIAEVMKKNLANDPAPITDVTVLARDAEGKFT